MASLSSQKSLQHRAVAWYHHYLQHPGHTRLEETLKAAMYWTGMHHTIRKYVNTQRENKARIDFDYMVGGKVLLWKEGILRKSESRYDSDPWTITTVHTNGTIRVQQGSKSERINIRRVTPFFEEEE